MRLFLWFSNTVHRVKKAPKIFEFSRQNLNQFCNIFRNCSKAKNFGAKIQSSFFRRYVRGFFQILVPHTFKFCAKGCLSFLRLLLHSVCVYFENAFAATTAFAYMPQALASEAASNFVIYSKFQTQWTWNFLL